MTTPNEPRALTAALQQPAFATKGGGLAMHVADRHVERWAPEGARQSRPLRNLGFVDRLVSPWIESAQRSASLRMFSQYIATGAGERATNAVSWVFPRPWYQDELDWMAASRQVGAQSAMAQASAPNMFTTRGTYVAPVQPQNQIALPTALYEYVAPSLSVARPDARPDSMTQDAYSPLVSHAASQAAQMMGRAIAPIIGNGGSAARMSPGLRAVLTTMLERSARSQTEVAPTRAYANAPELVTPPAPRAEGEIVGEASPATQLAEQYAEQRQRIVELQRVARIAAEREHAVRAESRAPEAQPAQRQAEIQQRASELAAARLQQAEARDTARREVERTTVDSERARLEERIQQRIAERQRVEGQQRLHESARDAAARDARNAPVPVSSERPTAIEQGQPERRAAAEIAAAVAALPPELQSMVAAGIGQRPDRAVQAIAELGEALRAVELIARNSASGGSFESTRGPRLVMPAGLGGLVSTVERTTATERSQRMPSFAPTAAPIAPAAMARSEMRMPAPQWLAARAQVASGPAPTSALGAAVSMTPAALQHVAWSDRWLARFAGARPQSLDVLSVASASPETRIQMLAAAAPGSIFVAPDFADESGQPGGRAAQVAASSSKVNEVVRYDDNAETPDDVLFAIAASATKTRSAAAAAAAAASAPATDSVPTRDTPRETLADLLAHAVPGAPGAGLSAQLASSPFAPALRHVMPLPAAASFDVRALFGTSLGATYLAGLLGESSSEISIGSAAPAWAMAESPLASIGESMESTRTLGDWQPTYVAPEATDIADASLEGEAAQAAEAAQMAAPLTTLRSALLSWDVETLGATETGGAVETRVSAPTVAGSPLARTLIDAMTMPMLAEPAATRERNPLDVAYASPGMIADRAHAWSVAQERSSADLAFDFVTPELVLAARVYGLGPAEAAQAARLAVAGPGQLTAMAGAVDRTFVQAMAIESERRGERARITTAFPVAAGAASSSSSSVASTSSYSPADAADTSPYHAFTSSGSAFGVDRRQPRGAFLFPAAAMAALGLNAASPDGEQSMSVAALELLAAQGVAELGTYAALGTDVERAMLGGDAGAARGSTGAGAEPRDEDVLATAGSFVPAGRRDKFEALYVALSQSPSGRTWSPAARAARALALAGRGDEAVTARERASVAWDVLPVVYGLSDTDGEGQQTQSLSTGDAAARMVRRRDELRALDPTYVERPGLGALSARAGEALGSYVSPSSESSSSGSSGSPSSSSSRDVGAVLRAPSAAPELVQTGRPAGRFGGGEVEIPSWFEQAARKMLEDRSGASDGISLAELTLVTAAPSTQIAASSRDGSGAANAPVAVSPGAAAGAEKQQVDIEKIANEVYREVLVLMDTARARNGEPYL